MLCYFPKIYYYLSFISLIFIQENNVIYSQFTFLQIFLNNLKIEKYYNLRYIEKKKMEMSKIS